MSFTPQRRAPAQPVSDPANWTAYDLQGETGWIPELGVDQSHCHRLLGALASQRHIPMSIMRDTLYFDA